MKRFFSTHFILFILSSMIIPCLLSAESSKLAQAEKDYDNCLTDNNNDASKCITLRQARDGQREVAQKDKNKCIKTKSEAQNAPANDDTSAEQDSNYGSNYFRQCSKLSKNNFRKLYKNGNKIEWENYIKAYPEYIDLLCKSEEGSDEDKRKYSEEAKKKYESLNQLASDCDVAAFIIVEIYKRDWNNPEHTAYTSAKGSTNPPLECTRDGIETIDFEPCKTFINNGEIIDVVQGAVQTGQELILKDKNMDAQVEASKSGDTATGGLKAMQKGLKNQQEMMNQRVAMDAGKIGILTSYYYDMPSYEEVKGKCISQYKNPVIPGMNPEGACIRAMANKFSFLKNQAIKDKMKAKLVKSGVELARDALMADMAGKRADQVGNAIANIDSFKPIDPLAPATEVQTTYCQQNPGDAKCLTGGLDRTFDAMGDNVITFGEVGSGTSYSNKNPLQDATTNNQNAISPNSDKRVTGVGSTIADNGQKGGLEFKPDAATISSGGGGPGGSSGGGGGGGGGAGGGSGGGPSGPAGASTPGAIAGKAPSYSGGGGSLSMMGGYGINKSKSSGKSDENPFGKLFGKDGNKSGIVNFRDIASQSISQKDKNIFENISARYSKISSDKRLLEYELAK